MPSVPLPPPSPRSQLQDHTSDSTSFSILRVKASGPHLRFHLLLHPSGHSFRTTLQILPPLHPPGHSFRATLQIPLPSPFFGSHLQDHTSDAFLTAEHKSPTLWMLLIPLPSPACTKAAMSPLIGLARGMVPSVFLLAAITMAEIW